MFNSHYPYRTYPVSAHTPNPYNSSPYNSSPYNSEYLRALADERAARDRVLAAQRAEEEARERANRARAAAAARQAYASPYNSYLSDDYDDYDLGGPDSDESPYAYGARPYGYNNPYGNRPSAHSPYGMTARQQQQLLADQHRRELAELERARERERMRLEETRRARMEEERRRRALEEDRRLEEERLRRLIQEEQRRAQEEELLRRRRQSGLEPLFFSFSPVQADEPMASSPPRTGRVPIRGQTTSPTRHTAPSPRRAEQPVPQPHNSHLRAEPQPSSGRPTSVPPRPSPSPQPASEQARPQPQPQPRTQDPPKSTFSAPTPEQLEAASKIREFSRTYSRRRRALAKLRDLRTRFNELRHSFVLPPVVDFECPAGYAGAARGEPDGQRYIHVEVPPEVNAAFASGLPQTLARTEEEPPEKTAPKLAYTPANAALHAYEEELNRLLIALDATESHGDAWVRDARRRLARAVEREAERLEKWREAVWDAFMQRTSQQQQPEQTPAASERIVEPVNNDSRLPAPAPVEADAPESADVEMPSESVNSLPAASAAPVEADVPESADTEMMPESRQDLPAMSAVPVEADAAEAADVEMPSEPVHGHPTTSAAPVEADAPESKDTDMQPGSISRVPYASERTAFEPIHTDAPVPGPAPAGADVPDDADADMVPSDLEQEHAHMEMRPTTTMAPTPGAPYTPPPVYNAPASPLAPVADAGAHATPPLSPDRPHEPVDLDLDLDLDTETDADAEHGPRTPPPAAAFDIAGSRSPVVVSSTEQFAPAVAAGDKFSLAVPQKEASSLVDREWREVEGFDMF